MDRIASIQVLGNIKVVGTGDLGSDKLNIGVSEYLDAAGNLIIEPSLDGSLIDGAITYRKAAGKLPNGSLYQLA